MTGRQRGVGTPIAFQAGMAKTIDALVNGGDWACAHADPRSLADVCQELASVLGAEFAPELESIAQNAPVDMERASWEWLELSRRLHRLPPTAPETPSAPGASYA